MVDRSAHAPIVVVMGVTGAGKSTVGPPLAEALRVPFADADDHHAADAVEQMRAGRPLTDEDRKPWLERLNLLLLEWRLQESGGVLACSALSGRSRAELTRDLSGVRFVWLTGDGATIRDRLEAREGHYAGVELLPSQMDELEAPADAIRVDVFGSVDQVVGRAVEALQAVEHTDILPFADRRHAGEVLARHLVDLEGEDVVVLGLLRGGVPVAAEVAARLGVPVGAIAVRKISAPGQPELALGAATANGVLVLDDAAAASFGLSERELEQRAQAAQAEAAAMERRYLPVGPAVDLLGRTVVLVDDGLATGASMRAAVAAVRLDGAAEVVVAAPVGAAQACRSLSTDADRVVCPVTPRAFGAVSKWFGDFRQVSEEEVSAALRQVHSP